MLNQAFRKCAIGVVLVLLLGNLAACAPAAAVVPTERVQPPPASPPTDTAVPASPTPEASLTPTLEPTATVVPTATPANQIFRDDFNGVLQPGWTWENENPRRWTLTQDGWLQIMGEDASLLGGQAESNLLWRDLPDGDFAITTHLEAAPTTDFQQATIYLYEDSQNFVALNRGYCSPCGTGGNGVYMEFKVGGAWGTYSVALPETDLYLRLEFKNNVITGYYATKPDQWQRLGKFGNYFVFKRVGLGVTNADGKGLNADLLGRFDYFEITRPK